MALTGKGSSSFLFLPVLLSCVCCARLLCLLALAAHEQVQLLQEQASKRAQLQVSHPSASLARTERRA